MMLAAMPHISFADFAIIAIFDTPLFRHYAADCLIRYCRHYFHADYFR
jgi:hypothetical protein